MEGLNVLLAAANRLFLNYKKTGTRGYSKNTLIQKLEELEEIRVDFKKIAASEQLDKVSLLDIKEKFKNIYEKTKEVFSNAIEAKKQEEVIKNIETIERTMASFNIEVALKAIPTFLGNRQELESFLKITEILYGGLDSGGKKALIDFVYYAKLSSCVRTTLGTISVPTDFGTLKQKLLEAYKKGVTVAQLHTTLAGLTQKRLSITIYKDKLLAAINDLNEIQINNLGSAASEAERSVVVKMNDNYALTIFKNGLDDGFRSTIFAAQPKTLTEAVNLALELEKSQRPEQIFIMNKNNNYDYDNNKRNVKSNNNNNFRNYNNRNDNFRNNNNSNNNNFGSYNNNFRNYNNGYNFANNSNSNNFRGNNNNNFRTNNNTSNNNRFRTNNNNGFNSNRNRGNARINVVTDQGNAIDPEDDYQGPSGERQ